MERAELTELHYITPIANLASILKHGILSHRLAASLPHHSVAMSEIQERRQGVCVPGGRPLHEYANLYLCARNPMLFKRRDRHPELCVLPVSTDVLDLPGVIITDGNAASSYTRFLPSPQGLEEIDHRLVFAKYWTDWDIFQQWHKKRAKCAEVLVPERVPPNFITGIYVSCSQSLQRCLCLSLKPNLVVKVDAHLFFLSYEGGCDG